MARLKSCPFTHLRQVGALSQAGKSCPFTHLRQVGALSQAGKSCPFRHLRRDDAFGMAVKLCPLRCLDRNSRSVPRAEARPLFWGFNGTTEVVPLHTSTPSGCSFTGLGSRAPSHIYAQWVLFHRAGKSCPFTHLRRDGAFRMAVKLCPFTYAACLARCSESNVHSRFRTDGGLVSMISSPHYAQNKPFRFPAVWWGKCNWEGTVWCAWRFG
jgi:hypothetical protein